MRVTTPLGPLPYAPPIEADESLWSWITRIALYHGWSADELLLLLGVGTSSWESYFRQPDVDCGAPPGLIDRLAEVTGFSRALLANHMIKPSPSTLWLDERVAFCETCWSEDAIPYVRRAWLDAWCIDCPVHGCPLVMIEEVRRSRHAADWNAAWSCRIDWAERSRAPCSPGIRQDFMSGERRMMRPLGAFERATVLVSRAEGEVAGSPVGEYERRLVLLSGKRWGEWSLVRAYFDAHEVLQWRNSARGYDPGQGVVEPLGSLNLRSGAIRIGRTLFDVLFDRAYREPRIAGPVRCWVGGLFDRPRVWLMKELATWPTPVVERWKRKFEWTDELEWLRLARSENTPHKVLVSGRRVIA